MERKKLDIPCVDLQSSKCKLHDWRRSLDRALSFGPKVGVDSGADELGVLC